MDKHAMVGAGATIDHTLSSSPSGVNNDNNKLYKGVRKRKWGKWVSEIRLPNSRERIWLGSYDSPEKAARAFDAALYCLRGRHASFNFPDTPFNLDINVAAAGDQSLTPQKIQEVAARFANEDPQMLQLVDHNNGNGQPQGNSSFGSKSHIEKSESSTCCYTTASPSSTPSTSIMEHGDMNTIDWTFLNVLDDSSEVLVGSNDYGLYSEIDDKIHSGELLYSTPPPFQEEEEIELGDGDPFSHQSFLWNWNF
ncbi:DNA-binding domain superfamily [Sesbania bispinosa]|nr:DNA-binding domain superfamily [Sesbania bispinosa]